MARIVLGGTELALLSDLTRRVVLPHVTAMPITRGYEKTLVRFAGDTFPTPFRGEGRTVAYALTCLFATYEQHLLVALLALVDEAAGLPDSRMLLRSHLGPAVGLAEALAVVVGDVQQIPEPGNVTTVQIPCDVVEWDRADR